MAIIVILVLGYLIMVGVMIGAQMLLWKRFKIGEDYELFGIFSSEYVFLAVFWPATIIPYAFYAVVKYYIDKGNQ